MIDIQYENDFIDCRLKLFQLMANVYGPEYTIDILKECIKILQPYAEKEREKTHA